MLDLVMCFAVCCSIAIMPCLVKCYNLLLLLPFLLPSMVNKDEYIIVLIFFAETLADDVICKRNGKL